MKRFIDSLTHSLNVFLYSRDSLVHTQTNSIGFFSILRYFGSCLSLFFWILTVIAPRIQTSHMVFHRIVVVVIVIWVFESNIIMVNIRSPTTTFSFSYQSLWMNDFENSRIQFKDFFKSKTEKIVFLVIPELDSIFLLSTTELPKGKNRRNAVNCMLNSNTIIYHSQENNSGYP